MSKSAIWKDLNSPFPTTPSKRTLYDLRSLPSNKYSLILLIVGSSFRSLYPYYLTIFPSGVIIVGKLPSFYFVELGILTYTTSDYPALSII
jgi:hypothetical protein